jgi:hypothetical protein
LSADKKKICRKKERDTEGKGERKKERKTLVKRRIRE